MSSVFDGFSECGTLEDWDNSVSIFSTLTVASSSKFMDFGESRFPLAGGFAFSFLTTARPAIFCLLTSGFSFKPTWNFKT